LRFTATQCRDGAANLFSNTLVFLAGEVIAIATLGIDLARNVFSVHVEDELGKLNILYECTAIKAL
jgi:hypothetical protein